MININKFIPLSPKVKSASNEALARMYNIKFLKAENKFYDSTKSFEGYMCNWSLKALPQFLKSIKYVGEMLCEKSKSSYFFHK